MELPETVAAKQNIDKDLKSGQVTFTINLTPDLQDLIEETLGIKVASIPLRWIKGDTKPHIDQGAIKFDKTYLAYITDSPGSFVIGQESYAMRQGTAFIFDEGLYHETINTGLEPRLLLGPMSEAGVAVGASGINISGPSGFFAYIKQESGTVYYSYDQITWTAVFSWPIFVSNSDLTPTSTFNINFTSNISVFGTAQHFIISSNYVQIGIRELSATGTITVDGVTGYPGLVQNSFSHSNVNVFNLMVSSINGSTLASGYGWVAGNYYARNGATSNYIINCYSDGDISDNSGGIVGDYAAENGGSLTVIGCSSVGQIGGVLSGGIVGQYAGYIGGIVTVQSCWSSGELVADAVGGIVGAFGINVDISNCYSIGSINGPNAGGILGSNSGSGSATITGCYSIGAIAGGNAGGICGSFNPTLGETDTVVISNCYTMGDVEHAITNSNGGIAGLLLVGPGSGDVNLTISNCYTAGVAISDGYFIGNNAAISGSGPGYSITNSYSEAGSGGTPGTWDSAYANISLTGVPSSYPGVGLTWISQDNTPTSQYELRAMGYTPYTVSVISGTSLVRTQYISLLAGSATPPGILTGLKYRILQKDGGDPGSYETIIIDYENGAIITNVATAAGTYTIYVYNHTEPNITNLTVVTMTVIAAAPVKNVAFPGYKIAYNQKSSFCGTRPVSTAAVGLGAMRGIGSYKRIVNTSRG